MNGYTQKGKKKHTVIFFYKRLIQFIFSSFCRLELNEKIRDWERVSERVWGGLYIPRALPSCLHSVAQTYAIRISQDEECCSKCQIGVVKEAVDGLYVLPSCLFFHVFVRSSFLFVMQRAYKVKWGSVGYNSLKKKKRDSALRRKRRDFVIHVGSMDLVMLVFCLGGGTFVLREIIVLIWKVLWNVHCLRRSRVALQPKAWCNKPRVYDVKNYFLCLSS